jgi:hypothetical protein
VTVKRVRPAQRKQIAARLRELRAEAEDLDANWPSDVAVRVAAISAECDRLAVRLGVTL